MRLPVEEEKLREALRAHGVVFALLFGSRATGTAHEHSDVDLAVWSPGDLDVWSLRGALPDEVDVVDVRRAPMGLAGRIALTGHVVLDDDPPARIRWVASTRKRHLDETHRREQFRRDFIAAHG